MIRNVGKLDRFLRFCLALFLIWFGFFYMDGLGGNDWGIFVAACALLPLYMAVTGSCFVFKWFKIHSLNNKELKSCGNPYPEKE